MTKLKNHLRFHEQHSHLARAFGNGWFALKAEQFARFFGTPTFLVAQTVVVTVWIGLNVLGFCFFDSYPFILLNLAFSLQAAYAAPLILLAQTRQAERDKAHAEADALHREDLAAASEERQKLAAAQTKKIEEIIEQNTEMLSKNTALTVTVEELAKRIDRLTTELHSRVLEKKSRI